MQFTSWMRFLSRSRAGLIFPAAAVLLACVCGTRRELVGHELVTPEPPGRCNYTSPVSGVCEFIRLEPWSGDDPRGATHRAIYRLPNAPEFVVWHGIPVGHEADVTAYYSQHGRVTCSYQSGGPCPPNVALEVADVPYRWQP